MIIILKPDATQDDAESIIHAIEEKQLKPLFMPGVERIVIGAIGDERVLQELNLQNLSCVESIKPVLSPYKLVSREVHPHDTLVKINEHLTVGGAEFAVIAGPCAIESQQQIRETAEMIKRYGVEALRGGAFKPRTSPYSFQGLGKQGLALMRKTCDELGMAMVSEVVDVYDIDLMAQYVDVFQIGARNMQNYSLLKKVGNMGKPIILKRGISATIDEFLLAAEYIYNEGNHAIILCESGIRTFETATCNTLDLNAVAYIKQKSHLPVIVDPSNGTGLRELVNPMSKAAAACGADGIVVECHVKPEKALSDGHQALDELQFKKLIAELRPFVSASGRTLS